MGKTEKPVAIVVGGSGGIGGAVARKMSSSGNMVYVGYHKNPEGAARIADEIAFEKGEVDTVRMDLGASGSIDEACENVFELHGRLDIVVNCAAVNVEAPALGMADAMWDDVVAVNLSGTFYLCRAAAKYMLLGRWGRIINFSSVSASSGGRGQINYAAGKAGVEALTRVLALELGRKGVTVNCIAPGVISTAMSARIRGEHESALLESIALRRFGRPEEVAGLARFLASDEAAYITGQVIRIDGGFRL